VNGEAPLEAAQRELAEEIGKAGETWEHLTDYVSSVGVMDEVVHVFLATGLSDAQAEAEDSERIEIVRWPLADLDGAIAATRDAKTLIGLLWLKTRGGRVGR
jgi:ADP-ribose pyrophosphatase